MRTAPRRSVWSNPSACAVAAVRSYLVPCRNGPRSTTGTVDAAALVEHGDLGAARERLVRDAEQRRGVISRRRPSCGRRSRGRTRSPSRGRCTVMPSSGEAFAAVACDADCKTARMRQLAGEPRRASARCSVPSAATVVVATAVHACVASSKRSIVDRAAGGAGERCRGSGRACRRIVPGARGDHDLRAAGGDDALGRGGGGACDAAAGGSPAATVGAARAATTSGAQRQLLPRGLDHVVFLRCLRGELTGSRRESSATTTVTPVDSPQRHRAASGSPVRRVETAAIRRAPT